MSEDLHPILSHALVEAVTIELQSKAEARSWRTRVYNFIRQHPQYAPLMITQDGAAIKIRVPRLKVTLGEAQ